MKNTNTFHKFIAGLLSFFMVLTMTLTAIPLTAFAYSGTLTIGGAIEEAFNFAMGGNDQEYLFSLQNPPENLQTYEWSVEGTLPEGLSLMNFTTANAYIGGKPTKVTTAPVALIVSVRASAANGDEYYGKKDILINVYKPVIPYEEAASLLKATECSVSMETANTKETVSEWLSNTWLGSVDGFLVALGGGFSISELSVILDENFTAATAGTASDPNGINGSVEFTVEIGGELSVCESLTCTIKATPYKNTSITPSPSSNDKPPHIPKDPIPKYEDVSEKTLNIDTDDASPQTGDNSNLWLWIVLLLVSGGAVTVLGIIGKKMQSGQR